MADVKMKVKVTKDYEATFTALELMKAVTGKANRLPYDLPPNAKVTIRIPGGGDYSNQTMDLDEVGGLTISWTEVEER